MSSLHSAEGLAEAVLRTSKIQFLRSLQAWAKRSGDLWRWWSGAMAQPWLKGVEDEGVSRRQWYCNHKNAYENMRMMTIMMCIYIYIRTYLYLYIKVYFGRYHGGCVGSLMSFVSLTFFTIPKQPWLFECLTCSEQLSHRHNLNCISTFADWIFPSTY